MAAPNIGDCEQRFIEAVIPERYRRLTIDINALINWFSEQIGGNPNEWRMGHAMMEAAEKFLKRQYQSSFMEKAVGKVNEFSNDDVKRWLLKFVSENPDVGLAILEE